MQLVVRAHVFSLVDQREVTVGAHQRHLLGDRRRHPRRHELGGGVDRVLGHHPVGGVLTAAIATRPGAGTATACSARRRVEQRQRRRQIAKIASDLLQRSGARPRRIPARARPLRHRRHHRHHLGRRGAPDRSHRQRDQLRVARPSARPRLRLPQVAELPLVPAGPPVRGQCACLGPGGPGPPLRLVEPLGLEKFEGVAYHRSALGLPVIDEALAEFECTIVHAYPGGDHTIFVGRSRPSTRAATTAASRCSTTAAASAASCSARDADRGPSASLAPSAAVPRNARDRRTDELSSAGPRHGPALPLRDYASRAAFGRRLASGPLSPSRSVSP